MSREEKEKKYRRIGWITSISAQALLLILFYFLVAWREPDPPIPTYGIELAFGLEESGQGEQPLSAEEPAEEPAEQTQSEIEPEEVEETLPEETTETVETESDFVEEVPVTETPSPDVIEPVETQKTTPAEEVKPTPKEKVETKKEEAKEKQPKEEPVNQDALMPASDGEPNDSKGDDKESGAKGKEEGSIDGRALMGEQGKSDGASLQMAGWVWDFQPNPQDNSDESGKIVYRIKVDDQGEIRGVELISSTVSPAVERYYQQAVERLTFSQTNEYSPAPISEGTVTFIIRSK